MGKLRHRAVSSPVMKLEHCSYCCSVPKSCPALCNPMACSTPSFPVLHCLLKFAQTHVHRVSDAIQPSHPLSPPSPLALNLSQHQGLFQWVSSSHQVAKVLEISALILPKNIQGWFPEFPGNFQVWLVWSPCNPRDSQEPIFFSTTIHVNVWQNPL